MRGPGESRGRERGVSLLKLLGALLLVLLLLTVWLVRVPLLRAFADWWIVDEQLEKAQAIVVLADDTANGDRVRHAVGLYRQGWASRLVLSGGRLRSYFSEAELMRREAMDQGVPAEDLILFSHAKNSALEEAAVLQEVLARHSLRSIIVVTSNFQTRRIRRIYHKLYRERGTRVWVSAAPDARFPPRRWWEEREAWRALSRELFESMVTWWALLDLRKFVGYGLPAAASAL